MLIFYKSNIDFPENICTFIGAKIMELAQDVDLVCFILYL